MGAISKNTKKKYDAIGASCVKALAQKHGVTESFVRMARDGQRQSATAEIIQKEYRILYEKLSKTIQQG